MSELAEMRCVPCAGGAEPLRGNELQSLARRLGGDWTVVEEHHLEKEFRCRDFVDALAFVNKVGALAEEEGHHPDIYLTWGKAAIRIWTHKIDGLTESDFVLAAKIERLA